MERLTTRAWLLALLADGPRRSSDIRRLAVAAGYTRKAVKRVREALGAEIIATRVGGHWTWEYCAPGAARRPAPPPPVPPALFVAGTWGRPSRKRA